MSNRFTEKAEKALNNAVKTAEEFGHTYIGSEHILLSLARAAESAAAIILNKHSATAEKMAVAIKEYSGSGLKSTLTPKDMTPCSKKIVEGSYRISIKYGAQKIGTEHILLALLEEKNSVAIKLLTYMGVEVSVLTDEVETLLRTTDKSNTQKSGTKAASSPLKQHGKNLTALAKEGKLDPVIGRDKETDRLIRILCRKNKNNPCLIGEAGVGKTAIVEGLAHRIAAGAVPSLLYGKEIISVDLTSMVSGTKYRGDFEERIKSLINEAATNRSVILFIDEIHTIVGAGAAEGAIDAANILKPQLSRAEIQLIGATTFTEYHKFIEKDAALERRFQPITVEEATPEQTKEILSGLKSRYEAHHGVCIDDSALSAAIRLSVRYIQDRYLPDKALDVLDEACAKANKKLSDKSKNIIDLDNKLKQIRIQKESAIKEGDFILAKRMQDAEDEYQNKRALADTTDVAIARRLIDESDIKEIINEMTGIPIVGIGEKVDKDALFSALSRHVIGQQDAIMRITDAVMRSESGIAAPDRPKGVFLFVGSSGVGKTELAKAMAEELVFDKRSFFKYDMSEFSEGNSVTKLIGSPPGYVGYEEGGALTEKVRRHPYCIILFDEIEKAHPDVLDLLLQIADNGNLTDNCGRCISFRNAYVILTSNIGADAIRDGGLGFVTANSGSAPSSRVIDSLSKRFRVEFLNRMDDIILFPPISRDDMIVIANSKLDELKKRLTSLGYDVRISDDLAAHIAHLSTERRFGVRHMLRLISTKIENPLSSLVISSTDEEKRQPIEIYVDAGEVVVRYIQAATSEII